MLEVCVDSVESAIAAEEGGADRLELCSSLVIGGVSPTAALYEAIRRRVALPVRAMVRPRFGDFLYTDFEKETMLAETSAWRALGIEGVVSGALLPDGRLVFPSCPQSDPGAGRGLQNAGQALSVRFFRHLASASP